MYTWGYIKEASLAKLDLDELEANDDNLLSRFHIYANEVITQVSSTVKPNRVFATFKIADKQKLWTKLKNKYNVYVDEQSPIDKPVELTTNEEIYFWHEFEEYKFIGDICTMPSDFISFGGDINTRQWTSYWNDVYVHECFDDDFEYKGYNKLVFRKEGIYDISYNARWYTFEATTDDDTFIDIPTDILDCIPSYIAHQCSKIDDQARSAEFRNEYEIFISRIDDTNYNGNKSIRILGDW